MSNAGIGVPEEKGSVARNKSSKELEREAAFKEKVDLFGPGAQIRVVLRNTSTSVEYKGEIDEIAADSFKLRTNDRTLPIRYDQIGTLNLKERSYKAQGQPDPVQVRRVAAEIGIGQKVKVELASAKRFSGIMQSVDKEKILIGSRENPVPVRLDDVRMLEKSHLPAWAKVVIAVGAVSVGLMVLVYVDYKRTHPKS